MNSKVGMQILGTARNFVKTQCYSKSSITRLAISILYVLKHAVHTAVRFRKDTNFRSIILLQLLNSKNLHQTTSLTYFDRYPIIFSACREYFNDKQDLKILSYGCSTGEEVLTLRRYFPTAHIIGAEINKSSLSICRTLPVDDKIKFIHSTSSEIQKHGPFDAIFCMAVLQRKPHEIKAKGIDSLKKIYPFEKFEQQIIELDSLINPKGLLVVHYTQYSLLDTEVAYKYEVLGDYNQNDYTLPTFDKNSNLLINKTFQNSIFIKDSQ